jgi:hypothetical protein
MSGRLIVDSKAIVNRMSRRQFGRATILEAGLGTRVQPMTGSLLMRVQPVSGSLLVRIKTVLPALLMCV